MSLKRRVCAARPQLTRIYIFGETKWYFVKPCDISRNSLTIPGGINHQSESTRHLHLIACFTKPWCFHIGQVQTLRMNLIFSEKYILLITVYSSSYMYVHCTEYKHSGWDPAKCRWDIAKWLESLAVNAKVATVLGSIPAFSDTVESEGRQMKQCWITYMKQTQKNSLYVHMYTF